MKGDSPLIQAVCRDDASRIHVSYLTLKTLHILFFALFLGAGIASVFYKVMADRTGEMAVIVATLRHLVVADLILIVPSVIALPLTGLMMLGWDISAPWVRMALLLYVLAGMPWLLAVKLQLDMRDLAIAASREGRGLDPRYARKSRRWLALGLPSFGFSLLIVFLMVHKGLPSW